MTSNYSILGVFAHPDDECYGPGGTLARYALSGMDTHVVCFTCGEAGSIGVSKDLARDELCRRRTEEFADACDALKVKSHRILGVPDKGVASVDREWAVSEIMHAIERTRPQVVVTFHHRGVSGHPDHIAVAGFLQEAFERCEPEGPVKLYEWGIPRQVGQLYQRRRLQPIEEHEIGAVIDVPDEAMDLKIEAIRRHETQYDFYLSMQEKFDYRSVARPEYFELRATRLARPAGVERDFFAQID